MPELATMVPVTKAVWAMLAAGVGWAAGGFAWQWAARLVDAGESLPSRRAARAACAVAWVGIALVHPCGLEALHYLLLAAVLVTLSLADLAELVIPDACVLVGLAVRVAFLAARTRGIAAGTSPGVVDSLGGALLAIVPLLGLTLLMDRMLGSESLGGGDLKLLGLAGLTVGWQGFLPLLFVACLLGVLTSAVFARRSGTGLEPFPFGPAIALSLWVAMLIPPFAGLVA